MQDVKQLVSTPHLTQLRHTLKQIRYRHRYGHRLNLELESKVYLDSVCTAVLIAVDPQYEPTRALLVSQDRRQILVTPCVMYLH
jgi:hypothetical protein